MGGVGPGERVAGDRGAVVLDPDPVGDLLERVVPHRGVRRPVEHDPLERLVDVGGLAAVHGVGVLPHPGADPHAGEAAGEGVALDDVALGAVAAFEPAGRDRLVLATVRVHEHPAGGVALEGVAADRVLPRPVDRQPLTAGAPVPELLASHRDQLPGRRSLGEAVVVDGVPGDGALLRAGLEVDAGAAGIVDVEAAQGHPAHVAVDEHAHAARGRELAVLDDDVAQRVVELVTGGEVVEAGAHDLEAVGEALDATVADRDVRHRAVRRGGDADALGRRGRVGDERALAVEDHVRRGDVEPAGVGAGRVQVGADHHRHPLARLGARDELGAGVRRGQRRRRDTDGAGGHGEADEARDDERDRREASDDGPAGRCVHGVPLSAGRRPR